MIETILIFLIVLGVLIFVHELGHFLFARMFGIRVDEFAIGFGPKIFSKKVTSKKHGDTVYALNAIPFGGYVKIFGENGESVSNGHHSTATLVDGHAHSQSRSLIHRPRYAQVLVLFAGILFNFLFAWFIVSAAFVGGLPVSTEDYGQYSSRFQDEHIVVVDISTGSPAEKMGLKAGDSLTSISSAPSGASSVSNIYYGTDLTIEKIQSIVDASDGKAVTFGYTEPGDSAVKTTTIVPATDIVPGHFAVGIAMDTAATLSLPLLPAIKEGTKYTLSTIESTVYGVGDLIGAIFHRNSAVLSEVSGPVGIATLVGQAAQSGFDYVLLLTAVISINLGVLNFLPFPALDGGRILFVIIEAIIRRPIKASLANMVNTVGFVILILLMVVVTFHDVAKIFIK